MSDRRPSIRRTLLTYVATLFVGGAILLYVAARGYGRSAADISYDRLLVASALAIVENVSVVQGNWHLELPYAALGSLAMAPDDRVYYRVVAPDGSTITGYGDLPLPPRAANDTASYFDASYHGEPVRFAVLRRWIARPVDPGYAWVQVGQTRLARTALANDITLRALLPIGLLTLVALPLLWLGVNRALRPMVDIEDDLLRRDPSDLHPVSGAVPVELAHLVGALNTFMTRLAENVELLRAFIADAAHQMRTPLASLRAQAQLAVDETDAAEQRRSLLLVESNAARLSHLLDQLLSDAIVTHRSDVRCFGEVDLAGVISEAIREAVPRAEPRADVRLLCQLDSAPFHGDALMIREAIKNLLANALHYGRPEAGPIDVSLDRQGDRYHIAISDHGPGIPASQLQTVFGRFQRGEAAGRAPGAGLGLAIVRRVIDAHAGSVTLENLARGGLAVRIELPVGGTP